MPRTSRTRKDQRKKPNTGADKRTKEIENSTCESGNSSKVEGKVPVNDVSWYASNPDLLRDSSSLAYSNSLGSSFNLGVSASASGTYADMTFPGILTYKVVYGPGRTDADNVTAVNIAATNIYSFVRHANSGRSNYDAPDLMLYILSMGSAYAMYSWLTRIYGLTRLYSQVNRYWPRAMVEAQGVDFDDINTNLADFRYFINTLPEKLGALCVPNTMPVFARWTWMFGNVFQDDDWAKAQAYMFVPDGYYVYNETTANTAGFAEYHRISAEYSSALKFADLKKIMNDMISKMVASEDCNIMSGDIFKAFGPSGVYALSGISEDFITIPAYVPEVLGQIHNLVCAGIPKGSSPVYSNFNVAQDAAGHLVWNPIFIMPLNNTDLKIEHKYVFDAMSDVPDPATNMVNSRLTADLYYETGSTASSVRTSGTEIVTTWDIWTYAPSGDNWTLQHLGENSSIIAVSTTAQFNAFSDYVKLMSALEKFDHHHFVYVLSYSTTDKVTTFLGVCGDVQNYTIISDYELSKMHETALLSEFAVPMMGAVHK